MAGLPQEQLTGAQGEGVCPLIARIPLDYAAPQGCVVLLEGGAPPNEVTVIVLVVLLLVVMFPNTATVIVP